MRSLPLLIYPLLVFSLESPSHAQFFRSWTSASGGSYSNPFNWSPSGVPNNNDGAGFGLNATYGVSFPNNQTTGTVTVGNGIVFFDLDTSGTDRTLSIPGTLTVDGPGRLITQDGTVAAANLLVQNGGILTDTDGTISSADSTVTVTGAGSSWTYPFTLEVGSSSTGGLTISSGGSVSANNDGEIATQAGSSGSVTITGTESIWDVNDELFVGRFGDGTLVISDGGRAESSSGQIAVLAGSIGKATVTGSGSTWHNETFLTVGSRSSGELIIENAGSVVNAMGAIGSGAIGSGSIGMVTVSGVGSTWTNNDSLTVGSAGTGMLTIEAGASVSSSTALMGRLTGSNGTVTVTDPGSAWNNSGNLTLGDEGTAALNIQNDGMVTVGSKGAGNLTSNSLSQITLESGGALDVHGNLDLNGGTLNLVGGTLFFESFSDLVGGTLVNQVGTLAPRNSATGPAVVNADFAQQVAGTLEIEIGATVPGFVDKLLVEGDALLNGTLEVLLPDGFVPALGNTFTIIETENAGTTFGNIIGQFGTVIAPIVNGLTFEPLYTSTSIELEVVEAAMTADFDLDGDVDGNDFLVWQRGSSPNGINSGDLALWQSQYGTPPPLASSRSVPEPASWLLTFSLLIRLLKRGSPWR